MDEVSIGQDGWRVSAQGLGCMTMDRQDQADAVIGRALELGVTFLDTADMYGWGRNEELVGRALRGHRDEVQLCTKFGVVRDGDGWGMRADAVYVREACEASLRRLGVETIDLYYLHHRHETVQIEETVGAMAQLVENGKVRHLGLSNVTEADLRAAHTVHPITALQPEWSLVSRDVEAMVPVCSALGVAIVPYSPQGKGALGAGQAAEARLARRAAAYAALPDRLAEVAARHGADPGQVALAWVHHRAAAWGLPVVPIPGTTRVDHLEANVAAAGLQLDEADLADLDSASRRDA